jgi:hypothetical protein
MMKGSKSLDESGEHRGILSKQAATILDTPLKQLLRENNGPARARLKPRWLEERRIYLH